MAKGKSDKVVDKEMTYREFCGVNPISRFKEFYLKKMFGDALAKESIWKERVKDKKN